MIHILSWATKNHQKTLSMPLNSKLKKIQGLFKTVRTLDKFTLKNLPNKSDGDKPTFYTLYTSHLR